MGGRTMRTGKDLLIKLRSFELLYDYKIEKNIVRSSMSYTRPRTCS